MTMMMTTTMTMIKNLDILLNNKKAAKIYFRRLFLCRNATLINLSLARKIQPEIHFGNAAHYTQYFLLF